MLNRISTQFALLAVAAICIALLGVALYLQHVENMQPCPWCVIQRYAFAMVALVCAVFAFLPVWQRTGTALAAVVALSGAGAACWHLWIKAHPGTSCGIDPLETSLNTVPTAQLLPFLFQADGFCTTEYPPILGLSIPQWALFWFIALALALGWLALRKKAD